MNLYLKYCILSYTWNTRFAHEGDKKVSLGKLLINTFSYLFIAIGIGGISIVYFFINGEISFTQLLSSLLLYGIIFLIYTIFYEIGYLHNSIVAKYEKNPTIRIYEKIPKNFYTIQIIIRIITGLLCISLLYWFNKTIGLMLLGNIVITGIIYYIHNTIRNYFYNFITLLLLRIMKFSLIFIILYYIFGTFDSTYYLYLSILFLLYQQFDHTSRFNKRMGGINKLGTNLGQYLYSTICCCLLYLVCGCTLFIYFGTIYFITFIILTPKKNFKINQNR